MNEDLFNIGFELDDIAVEENTDNVKTVEVEEDNSKTQNPNTVDPEEEVEQDLEVETDTTEKVGAVETKVDVEQEEEIEEQTDDDSPISPESAIYEILKDYGYADDLEEGQEVDLDNVFESLGDKAFMESIQSLPDKAKTILDIAYKNRGVVTDDDLKSLIQTTVDTPEVNYKENPKEFLLKELQDHPTFPTKEDLTDYLDDLEDKGKLGNIAENINKQLEEKKAAKLEQLEADLEKRNAEIEKKKAAYVESIQKEMDSTAWTDKHKANVSQVITNLGNISNQINQNPKALVKLADILTTFDPKTGEFDLEKITKSSSKQARKNADKVRSSKIGNILSKMDSSKISKGRTKKADDDDIVVVLPS